MKHIPLQSVKIEDQYKAHAVKIRSGQLEGSGCVFQPLSCNCTFILTAKHCIVSADGDFDPDALSVSGQNINDVKIKNAYWDDKDDIAVLIIDRIPGIPVTKVFHPEKGMAVNIYGYPNKLSGKPEERENVLCTVSFRHDNWFELSSQTVQFTFETATPENIIGLSGSGVFTESGTELHLVGIFTRLKGTDGAYHKFCAFNFSGYERLLTKQGFSLFDQDQTSAIRRDRDTMNEVFFLPYKEPSEPYYFQRQPDIFFQNSLDMPKHFWISGNSGVGKTNLALRNLAQKGKDFKFIDLSTLTGKTVTDHFEYINKEIIDLFEINPVSAKTNILERIVANLKNVRSDAEEIILFVDEVPISDQAQFYEFITGFITISEKYLYQSDNKKHIRWIISTRVNPKNHLSNGEDCLPNANKAHKNFNFKNLEAWDEQDLIQLLGILKKALNFSLSLSTSQKIVTTSKGFPGKLKDIIERMIIENCSIDEAIELVKTEGF